MTWSSGKELVRGKGLCNNCCEKELKTVGLAYTSGKAGRGRAYEADSSVFVLRTRTDVGEGDTAGGFEQDGEKMSATRTTFVTNVEKVSGRLLGNDALRCGRDRRLSTGACFSVVRATNGEIGEPKRTHEKSLRRKLQHLGLRGAPPPL